MGATPVPNEPAAPEVAWDIVDGNPTVVFAALFDAYAAELHGYLTRRVEAVADDLVAETFLAALATRRRYDPSRGDPRAWLYGIATNMIRQHARQERRALEKTARAARLHLDQIDDTARLVAEQVDAQRSTAAIADALLSLSDRDRDVLLLTAWSGLDGAQVAVALGIPAGTVRSRLHRARRLMQAAVLTTNADNLTVENTDA